MLLLTDCGVERGHDVAERLRAEMMHGQTCSAGIAVWDGEESPEALLARADGALYEAKRRGRDRVVSAATRAER